MNLQDYLDYKTTEFGPKVHFFCVLLKINISMPPAIY